MEGLRSRNHGNCIVCSATNRHGFHLEFSPTATGGVEAWFPGNRAGEGYDGWLHGGVIASLLDGAMTQCLFAHGRVAMTSELKVRFREPVSCERPARVAAWIERTVRRLHLLGAELIQEDRLKATAQGKFLEGLAPVGNATSEGRRDDRTP
jgi:acyl-coenzyme A thioesterase PaaI-like protein